MNLERLVACCSCLLVEFTRISLLIFTHWYSLEFRKTLLRLLHTAVMLDIILSRTFLICSSITSASLVFKKSSAASSTSCFTHPSRLGYCRRTLMAPFVTGKVAGAKLSQSGITSGTGLFVRNSRVAAYPSPSGFRTNELVPRSVGVPR